MLSIKKRFFLIKAFSCLLTIIHVYDQTSSFASLKSTFSKNTYLLLISQSILWIVLNIISSADIFWLTSKIIFINLHPFHADILGPLLFLMTATDIPQNAKCDLYLFTNGSWLVCQHEYSNIIKKYLNEDFPNICD